MTEKGPLIVRRGRCHCFGDDVATDDGLIPYRLAAARVTNARELVPQLFSALDPEFPGRVAHGDLVFAGRNFACGKPRLQGFIAMAALGLGVVCESMPYRMLRRAVARGIPVLVTGAPLGDFVRPGEEVEVDFATGAMHNLTRGERTHVSAMAPILREIVDRGGMTAMLREWLARHPEQAVERD